MVLCKANVLLGWLPSSDKKKKKNCISQLKKHSKNNFRFGKGGLIKEVLFILNNITHIIFLIIIYFTLY